MSTTLHLQLFQTRLSGPVILGPISILVIIGFIYSVFLRDEKLPKLPIALKKEVPNEKERIERYLSDTRELLIHGYQTVSAALCC